MLESLYIKNFALIDSLELNLSKGLNIFSGETGAGKSILIGALSLVLGARSDTSLIRTGCDESIVSAVVTIPSMKGLQNWLSDHGIEPEDNSLILKRILRKNGRSISYVQSEQVTIKDLQFIAQSMFEIHGQHEHQSLLNGNNQRVVLDTYEKITSLVTDYTEKYKDLTALLRRADQIKNDERNILREKDMLEFSVQEISAANISIGEDENLKSELNILNKSEQLDETLSDIVEGFRGNSYGAATGIIDQLRKTRKLIQQLTSIDPALEESAQRVESLLLEIEDIYEELRSYKDSIEFSPDRIDIIHDRLQILNNLKRKYGDTLEDILAYSEEAEKQLQTMEFSLEEAEKLQERIEIAERVLFKKAGVISERRNAAAEKLGPSIIEHLNQLGMPQADFSIHVETGQVEQSITEFTPSGLDTVEFLISPNQGEPLKPIKSIASGGELSRIMLALKSELSVGDMIDSMIFDEIDSGIGGTVAVAVGKHLKKLARSRQVLCITHIASIAAQADKHFMVSKSEVEARTITEVTSLSEKNRVIELARMLSGSSGESALMHAENLLQQTNS